MISLTCISGHIRGEGGGMGGVSHLKRTEVLLVVYFWG